MRKQVLPVLIALLVTMSLAGCAKEDATVTGPETSVTNNETSITAETTVETENSDTVNSDFETSEPMISTPAEPAVSPEIDDTTVAANDESADAYDVEYYWEIAMTAQPGDTVTFKDGSKHRVISMADSTMVWNYNNLCHHDVWGFSSLDERLKESDNPLETIRMHWSDEFNDDFFADATDLSSTKALEAFLDTKVHAGDIVVNYNYEIFIYAEYTSAADYSFITLKKYLEGPKKVLDVTAGVDPSTCVKLEYAYNDIGVVPGDFVILSNGSIHRIIDESIAEEAIRKTIYGTYEMDPGPFAFAQGDIFWSSIRQEYKYVTVSENGWGIYEASLNYVMNNWDEY